MPSNPISKTRVFNDLSAFLHDICRYLPIFMGIYRHTVGIACNSISSDYIGDKHIEYTTV